jgi:inosine-uridine nucleoside N-ribohydrolase
VAQIQGCFGHDVLAFVYLVEPELFTTLQGHISVATEGPTLGQTTMKSQLLSGTQTLNPSVMPHSTQACTEVDADACVASFERILMSSWLTGLKPE